MYCLVTLIHYYCCVLKTLLVVTLLVLCFIEVDEYPLALSNILGVMAPTHVLTEEPTDLSDLMHFHTARLVSSWDKSGLP